MTAQLRLRQIDIIMASTGVQLHDRSGSVSSAAASTYAEAGL
ncbi:hypothetical protein [Microvirga makkahensis]|nr:hypothetical protein [Microvirga makkahensis]